MDVSLALPPGVTIRPATEDDYDQIVQVWTEAGLKASLAGRESRAAFAQQVAQLGRLYLVAVLDESIVGVVLGSHDHRKGWINRLAVVPDCRRRGIAEALVWACEQEIRACGIEIIAALVEPDRKSSAALFRKLGYRTDVEVEYFRKPLRAGA